MMKAILVVNMPDYTDFETLTRAEIQIFNKDTRKFIYRNARLKPLPQKIDDEDNDLMISRGWNACIDEILGEENA